MTLSLEEAIARVPQWADVKGLKTSFLAGGITNQNYKVVNGDESFVVRLVGVDTELLGVNREAERLANTVAGEMGIAPEVIYFIEPENCLVTRFIDGRPLPAEEIGQPENIRRVVGQLKKVHALPEIETEFYPTQFVREGTQTAQRYDVPMPEDFDWLMERLDEIEAAINPQRSNFRLCHNDLLNANFLVNGNDEIIILDWEYAGMNDPYFDLGNFSAHHEFSDDQDDLLLSAYFGETTSQNRAHLKLMRIVSDYREATWALVQAGISQLDFDYDEYARKHIDRLTHMLHNPQYPQWISALTDG